MAMALPKQEGKKICNWFVAMPLPKQGVKKKNCGNCGNAILENGKEKKIVVAEIWGGIKKKKKSATSTIFLQHFHNKSQVISYYQFKFEFNTKITFLI